VLERASSQTCHISNFVRFGSIAANHGGCLAEAHGQPHVRNSGVPVVTYDDSARRLQGVQDANHIAYQMKDGVLVNRFRLIAVPIAAHVGSNDMNACLRKRVDLTTPRMPGFREAVGQYHQRARSHLRDIEMDAVASITRCIGPLIFTSVGCASACKGKALSAGGGTTGKSPRPAVAAGPSKPLKPPMKR
jgi:hypothetical protein